MSSKPFDATTKELVELAPADWLAFLGAPRPADRVALVDADVSTVTAAADKVIRVADDPPWLLHLEFQAGWDGALPGRMLAYNALLQDRHGVSAASAVVLLGKGANAAAVTGAHRVAPPFGPAWEFRYTVVRLWQVPVDRLLTGPLALVPLAPLGDVPPGRLRDLAPEMNARFAQAGLPMYDKLWSAVAAILGVRYDAMTADEMIASLPPDSVGVQAFQNLGRVRQTQDIILRQGRKRFGPPTPEVEAAVRGITRLDRLEPLTDRILDAASWDELLAQP